MRPDGCRFAAVLLVQPPYRSRKGDQGGIHWQCQCRAGGSFGFFRKASVVVITLGTAWTFKFNATGEIVSNCLKRDAKEFTRERLPVNICSMLLNSLVGRYPDKRFIFTVSPIRHLKDGAHGNQLSKSTLLMATERVVQDHPGQCVYFPAYEIMMDELRDYRFYAEDMVHPSAQAVNYIWERFCDFALPQAERATLERTEKHSCSLSIEVLRKRRRFKCLQLSAACSEASVSSWSFPYLSSSLSGARCRVR